MERETDLGREASLRNGNHRNMNKERVVKARSIDLKIGKIITHGHCNLTEGSTNIFDILLIGRSGLLELVVRKVIFYEAGHFTYDKVTERVLL